MDVYSFINSKAISEYCRSISHKFTPLEIAYLISKSKNIVTTNEKHEAWTELISTTPDMQVLPARPWNGQEAIESLHEFLKKYMEIERHGTMTDADKEFLRTFDDLWVEIPTPFKKGDILIDRSGHCCKGKPFVLDFIPCWTKDEKTLERLRKNGDETDMRCYIYTQHYRPDSCCRVWRDHGPVYLELEYCTRNLIGTERFLMALSSYLKDNLSLEYLLRAYDLYQLEFHARYEREFLRREINDTGLSLMGLSEQDLRYQRRNDFERRIKEGDTKSI